MTAPAIPKPDAKVMYRCVEPHTNDATGIHRVGDRLRGDHKAVLAAPLYWLPETLDTDEIDVERQRRGLS